MFEEYLLTFYLTTNHAVNWSYAGTHKELLLTGRVLLHTSSYS